MLFRIYITENGKLFWGRKRSSKKVKKGRGILNRGLEVLRLIYYLLPPKAMKNVAVMHDYN